LGAPFTHAGDVADQRPHRRRRRVDVDRDGSAHSVSRCCCDHHKNYDGPLVWVSRAVAFGECHGTGPTWLAATSSTRSSPLASTASSRAATAPSRSPTSLANSVSPRTPSTGTSRARTISSSPPLSGSSPTL